MDWLDEIIQAFRACGGTASLHEIYDLIAQTTQRSLAPSWQSIVRGTIEDHSSDAAFRRGRDIFYSVGGKGSGYWGVRNWPPPGQEFLSVNSSVLPEEIVGNQMYQEGAKKQITVNTYERSDTARKKCIQHYGVKCFVCGFDFQNKYGDVGIGFIHVHHLQPLSTITEEYELDPINDLRPVCPNCHAIIHRRNPPHTLEEMKDIVQNKLWTD
jgi:hypothetical protein